MPEWWRGEGGRVHRQGICEVTCCTLDVIGR